MKRMDLWRCHASISWYLQFFSLIFYGALVIIILSAPLQSRVDSLWPLLLTVTILCAFLTENYLTSMRGEIIIRREEQLKMRYNFEEWQIESKPFILKGVIFFKLKSLSKNRRKYLLLTHDNMSAEEWTTLNQFLQQQFE